jgi:hypothetical protein
MRKKLNDAGTAGIRVPDKSGIQMVNGKNQASDNQTIQKLDTFLEAVGLF